MLDSIMMATAANVELEAEPIPSDWILSGEPKARAKKMSMSRDWTSSIVVWDCTAGTFDWHYDQDEAVIVISGTAVLLGTNGDTDVKTRTIGPGDLAFFPAGTTAKWRVDEYIRKIAVLREPVWRPIGMGLKVWNKALRSVGLKGKSAI
jgi:uncharacterized protein